jgi:hypothetical protein
MTDSGARAVFEPAPGGSLGMAASISDDQSIFAVSADNRSTLMIWTLKLP